MRTMPCGHRVVCRKCFVKTIQTAVAERCLPLRCVVCRTKILKLKQQQPSLAYHVTHQQQQQQQRHHGHKALLFGSSTKASVATTQSKLSATVGSHQLHSTPTTLMKMGPVQHTGHNQLQPQHQHQHQLRSKTESAQSGIVLKRNAVVGATSSTIQTSTTGGLHGQPSSSPAVKSSSGQGPGGLQLLSAAFGLCGRQTPPVASAGAAVGGATVAAAGVSVSASGPSGGRSSRPMQPLLIYPTDALSSATGVADRWWPGVPRWSTIGWSDDGDLLAGGVSRPTDDRSHGVSSASPVIVLSSSGGRRRSKLAAPGLQHMMPTYNVGK